MRVGSASWSIDVSSEWSVTDHPECLTLEASDQGALQVSSAHKQAGPVVEEDLLLFADQHDSWGKSEPASCGAFDGVVFEYIEGGSSWRRWFLKQGQTLLFITYNGTLQAAEREHAAVDHVLSTIRAERSGEA